MAPTGVAVATDRGHGVIAALEDPRPTLDRTRAALEALAPLRGVPVPLEQVREVVVIASSSRGGSSVFAELLRGVPGLSHLQAEINPFVVLAGAGPYESGRGDDRLDATDGVDSAVWARELGLDIGAPTAVVGPRGAVDTAAWAAAITARLLMQWPSLGLEPGRVLQAAVAALRGPDPVEPTAGGALRRVMAALQPQWPALRLSAYDLPPEPGAGLFEAAPPVPIPVEEPPFVAVGPWTRGVFGPLVIKTPSNCYRLDWLAARFPAARMRVLHLVRNPAASINGLVDGWRSAGFHSHALRLPLDGALGAALPHWDRGHWKFDLLPDWRRLRREPLAVVAGHQWAAAHGATCAWLDAHPEVPRLRVRFEEVVGEPDEQARALTAVAAFLGLPSADALCTRARGALPVVMATAPPRARRWFGRAEALSEALALPQVHQLSAQLALGDPSTWR